MVGAGVLNECLTDPQVSSVLAVVRAPTGRSHPKLREAILTDFLDYTPLAADFAACDACFFCLGVSSAGMSEARYSSLTYDLTLAAARALAVTSPAAVFCYVSGLGTDSTERGRSMWARVKGRTENALLALPFRAAYMFRPDFIQPKHGVRSRTPAYRAFYTVAAPLYPLLRLLMPRYWTTTENLARAMIRVASVGYAKPILYSNDINALAAPGPA
jgi:uncharacterized protein YbjT (DUF2867 family)